jgi:hypothetical protein
MQEMDFPHLTKQHIVERHSIILVCVKCGGFRNYSNPDSFMQDRPLC